MVRQQFVQVRCSGFAIFRKLTGGQKQARRAIAQQIMVFDFFAGQFGHRNRVHLGRRGFTIAQEFSRILTVFTGAAEVLPKAPGFELHFCPALIAFNGRAFITANFVFARLKLERTAIRIVAAQVKFGVLIDQILRHGGLAFLTTTFL